MILFNYKSQTTSYFVNVSVANSFGHKIRPSSNH